MKNVNWHSSSYSVFVQKFGSKEWLPTHIDHGSIDDGVLDEMLGERCDNTLNVAYKVIEHNYDDTKKRVYAKEKLSSDVVKSFKGRLKFKEIESKRLAIEKQRENDPEWQAWLIEAKKNVNVTGEGL